MIKAEKSPRRDAATPTDAIAILLVDDDADCRLLLRDAIADSRVRNTVYEVSTAEEAWQFLHRQPPYANVPRPGLIYLDVEMPGMGGLALLAKIKGDPDLRDITVVMMTGVAEEGHMRDAARAGANSYTVKPANAEQFLKTVMESTNYWLTIHQYPHHHLPQHLCRR
jgi:CheY-like chemotaxis protein